MSQSDQVLRTGVLFKKGSGAGPFGRRNWKPRYFVLTPSRLRYYTFEDGDLKGEVDLSGCDEGMIEVMPMDSMKTGSSASTIWRIAVNAPERRLLVAAGTEMEMNDWVDKLMMAFRVNHGQPMHLSSRASLSSPGSGHGYASDATRATGVGGGAAITDFHNFTVARRPGHGSRQSTGSSVDVVHRLSGSFQHSSEPPPPPRKHSVRNQSETQAAARQLQEMQTDELQREEEERERAYQAEQTRRYEEAKRAEVAAAAAAEAAARRQQEEEDARRYHEEALRQQQQQDAEEEEAEQQRVALRLQLLAVEEEREREQRRNQEAVIEEQRRVKREKHQQERAAREQQIREQEQRAAAAARLDSGEEYDLDGSSGEDGDLDRDATATAEAAAPRSSLIGDVKREAMLKQQAAHQRRREASLKEEQRRQREVEVPPRVVEVTRRVPPAAPSAAQASRLSAPKVDSFEL
ncbi:hypothetical protein PybrP1_009173 [[Pythium] brassicae (nom. inval.)]|nr:hypothetical protein PybrP1_009173 [[Pythium] brassicae (nom. inval.)]